MADAEGAENQDDAQNDPDDFGDHPFTPFERRRLRRMLRDDAYDRIIIQHRRGTVKVWLISMGAVGAILVSAKTLFWEFIKGFLK